MPVRCNPLITESNPSISSLKSDFSNLVLVTILNFLNRWLKVRSLQRTFSSFSLLKFVLIAQQGRASNAPVHEAPVKAREELSSYTLNRAMSFASIPQEMR
jgi:hypothetical protein